MSNLLRGRVTDCMSIVISGTQKISFKKLQCQLGKDSGWGDILSY